ncbi:hypothetical protein Pd630_LPD16003 (plasmid) [Rhodococcus opacus PD630]|nr:hypothetical protein Pd630_LPD16003 [Rhodococcus opacus PD630]
MLSTSPVDTRGYHGVLLAGDQRDGIDDSTDTCRVDGYLADRLDGIRRIGVRVRAVSPTLGATSIGEVR